jgi:heat shock protein HtpX
VVIRFALSRQREYLADSGSVELTKNPDAMISALRKIEGRGDIPSANSAVMEMCIDDPRTGFSSLFDTHPSVDARVAALVQFAGGHDPGPLVIAPPEEPQPEALPHGPWNQDAPDGSQSDQSPHPWGEPPKDGPKGGPWG